jgi:hypothetical protein
MLPRRLLPAALALLALAAPLRAQQDPTGSFEEEAKRYEASLARPALYLRTLAAERFARTHDVRALRALLARYLRPEKPEPEVRALLAGIAGDAFTAAEALDPFLEVARRADGPRDMWLWRQALGLEAAQRGPEPVADVAADPKVEAVLRAAALDVLATEARQDVALATVPRVLGGASRLRGAQRALLVEACAWVLPCARARLGSDAFTAAAGLVIDALDEKRLGSRSRLVIARALCRALASDALYLDAAPWRRLLAAKAAAAAQGPAPAGATHVRVEGGSGVTAPRFLGIEGAGLRVVFVVDLSDSMLTPIKKEELDDLRRPRTGDAQAAPEDDLPWDRLKTRFDVARAALRRSLGALGPGMSFAVVVFGTKAEALLGPGLVRATKPNVERALAALDAIAPGPAAAGREQGTLRGYTNLHGALRLAFRLTEGPPLPSDEDVAPAGFDTGCDTIFVLSDGEPSWDDFDQEDVRLDDMHAGDPETGASAKDEDRLHYYGPYVEWRFLLRDVARMNLLRRAEVHCVGVGEASPELLRQLAELGRGQLRVLGARR